MNEMLKYLSEVEDLIKGQDLKEIEGMMGVTKENMEFHFSAYDKLSSQINSINEEAKKAIESLSFYEKTKVSKSKGKDSYL
mmetsp:Transcript_28212/g.21088  ORF Transcript_28212/g.21088 Transcript_28212/m.21088 type:complete len:81 (+) Transcript_28212:784-1026(+)|eukprot:CAMPEP_0202961476 /NCGR_PEP_ID=MMETSP1396-20130829/5531_1 /ASSEMBLY_ACC=CAM_ASM_000872 /TAXON_ID= /ORGANISM="Pseudokeronopsis sp., Strain Brazil" /LENGTH=80 /DNA_ID=CAMNT_0049681317 /DNA_START=886 /DNA_END=1128 /DNA_ORIENTATION=-